MIVFGKNLLFDEKIEDIEKKNCDFETIWVREVSLKKSSKEFVFKTEWLSMSGQQARYWSNRNFSETDGLFSWALEIKDVITLVWNAEKREIGYGKDVNYSTERLYFWVLHTFFPLVLEFERTYRILHAGSVEIDGKPVAFSAFSFGGKSTLTNYFLQQGHMLLSDDSLGIKKHNSKYYAISSYPFYRPYRKLETLGYYTNRFYTKHQPLHAVYLLDKRDPDTPICITELKGIEKFKAFHYSSLIDFDFMKQERFVFFTEMAKSVPVYRIVYPHKMEKLPEVYREIIAHIGKGSSLKT